MRYTISRTSGPWDFDPERPPCDRAYPGTIPGFQYWTFKTVAEAKRRYPDHEFEKHGDGVRSKWDDHDVWFIDIEDLADLMGLFESEGRLVIESNWVNHDQAHIEIYDYYRE